MDEGMKTYQVKLIHHHSKSIASLYFESDFAPRPGQFVQVWLPGVDEKPFSVSSFESGLLELTVCGVGPMSRGLLQVGVGARLGLRGPFGRGFTPREPALLIGGGMGVAPLRFLALEMGKLGIRPTILAGSRTGGELMFRDWLREAGALVATDDGTLGHHGLVTELLDSALAGMPENATIFSCGPEAMMLGVKAQAEARGLDYQLALERYMKCGTGICGQCCLDGSGARVCCEGPVFGPEELNLITELGRPHRGPTGAR